MDKFRHFFNSDAISRIALSIIIPIIISLFSYVAAQAKYTEKLDMAENSISKLETTSNQHEEKLQNHILDNRKESDELLTEIRVLDSKLDSIKEDLRDLKRIQQRR